MSGCDYSVLFIGKADDAYTKRALEFCELSFGSVISCLGRWGDPLPTTVDQWSGDLILSYLARWILPERVLKHARVAALNFHAAPPEYPGVGGNNFALYENATEYGITCHHMAAAVDSGEIVAVRRFPVFPSDDVTSLLTRIYDYQLVFFYEVVGNIISGQPIGRSSEKWKRKPITRKQMDSLFEITPEMSVEEVNRRVRATSFGPWQPRLRFAGHVFELKTGDQR